MKYIITILFLIMTFVTDAQKKEIYLKEKGKGQQLIVDGKPFLVLGGEIGNSSAACFDDI